MKIIIFLLLLLNFVHADICTDNFGESWGVDAIIDQSAKDDLWGSCDTTNDNCPWARPTDETRSVDNTNHTITYYHYTDWEPVGSSTSKIEFYRLRMTVSCIEHTCSENEFWDSSLSRCVPSCSLGSHYDNSVESCVCDNGYSSSYDASGVLVCEPPVCPGMYQGLPHFNTVDSVADCNFFQMSDGAALERPDGKICCYGQSAIDDNNTCPDNEVNIDGVCYPIEHDDNDTDHQCGEGQYWSIYSNSCVDWFPENNDTNITGNQGGGSGTGDGTNGAGRDSKVSDSTMGDLFGGEMSNSEYSDGLQGFGERAINKVKEAMNSYVLIHLPINVSGECGQNLRANFSILGKSYHIDIQDQFAEINQYNSQIYALVLFLFAISGVVLVLSGGKE